MAMDGPSDLKLTEELLQEHCLATSDPKHLVLDASTAWKSTHSAYASGSQVTTSCGIDSMQLQMEIADAHAGAGYGGSVIDLVSPEDVPVEVEIEYDPNSYSPLGVTPFSWPDDLDEYLRQAAEQPEPSPTPKRTRETVFLQEKEKCRLDFCLALLES